MSESISCLSVGDWIQETTSGLRGVILANTPCEVLFLNGEIKQLDPSKLELRPLRRAKAVSFEGKVWELRKASSEVFRAHDLPFVSRFERTKAPTRSLDLRGKL